MEYYPEGAGLQKECLRLGYLLSLADEHFRLPAEVMGPLLFPGLFVGDVLSGIYFVFEVNFFMRSTYLHAGRMLLQQRGVDFRPYLTLQPDFILTLHFLSPLAFQLFNGSLYVDTFRSSQMMFPGRRTLKVMHC